METEEEAVSIFHCPDCKTTFSIMGECNAKDVFCPNLYCNTLLDVIAVGIIRNPKQLPLSFTSIGKVNGLPAWRIGVKIE